ncbi:MAG TPA: AMP-binding protein [Phycisphaerae bacterium]|nr:AMP-binding protein [Phycisphaerae bacterium]
MINALLRIFVKALLSLRYRVRIVGRNRISPAARRGILFLPNHPALIDPIMVLAYLQERFAPRALADKDQIDRFFIRWLARRVGARAIPDMVQYGAGAREKVRQELAWCAEALQRGENVLLYPSGRLYRGRFEDLAASRAAKRRRDLAPDARVVLVRITGLWGSGFGWASGHEPRVAAVFRKGVVSLLLNGIFFSPRREVTIELHEPADLPRSADRAALNRFLDEFYNRVAPPNTYVPHTIWEPGGVRVLPEPVPAEARGDLSAVAPATRQAVEEFLKDLAGLPKVAPTDRLAHDLGLDSIAAAEVAVWVEREFGAALVDVAGLRTVSDVMLAAGGQPVGLAPAELMPVPAKWFAERPGNPPAEAPPGRTVTELFLRQARAAPGKLIIADQVRGAMSYRDIVTAVMALKPAIEKLPGQRVGIMLPASVAASVTYLAVLFAGKTPVMVNWTLGPANMRRSLDVAGVTHILTAERLLSRLESAGTQLPEIRDRFVPLERLAGGISLLRKLRAAVTSRLSWRALTGAQVPDTAAILFTSGSERAPKAVPLTHTNIVANIRDVASVLTLRANDRLLGFLPPFHSFGLTVTMLTPLLLGFRAAYHPNPTDGGMLARLFERYAATLLAGAPTFVGGILGAAAAGQLARLRLVVTGAEKCPDPVHDALAERCPRAALVEGYGVTECSPIISVDDDRAPRRGTVGKAIPSCEYAIVDEDAVRRVDRGEAGMFLVRGPGVFGGYLNSDVESPFVEFEGKRWYRTGDLLSEDADGVLTFRGRRKRFVKVGGEMVSLPAVEAALEDCCRPPGADGPVLAVEPAPGEGRPQLVLFTTLEIDRETVNRRLREAGLSALHNIHRVVRLDQIPTLGTGKTDYRRLREMLRDS